MKVGFLITARLKSTRLPNKLLKKVQGENFMTLMIKRLKLSNELSEIVVCTSQNPQDDPLEEIARTQGVKCFRGSEEDVMLRLYEAAKKYNLDYVINMTADCPLLPYELIPEMIVYYKKTGADLIKCHDLPVGIYLSGIKIAAMEKVIEIKATGFSEYWLYYFLKTDLFNVKSLPIKNSLKRNNYRIVLDYLEDYDFLVELYKGLGKDAYKAKTDKIISFLDNNSHLADINKACNKKGELRTKEDATSQVILKDGTIIK